MNSSRHFPTPPLPPLATPVAQGKNVKRHGTIRRYTNEEYISVARQLGEKCWAYYERETYEDATTHGSLYVGGLGPCAYLRLRLALYHLQSARNSSEELESAAMHGSLAKNLLREGLRTTEVACDPKHGVTSRGKVVCTLLEGQVSGAIAVKCAILNAMGRLDEAKSAAKGLLALGETPSSPVQRLGSAECEVLYGRAGYLHCILFVRRHLSLPAFGQKVAIDIIEHIISEGEATANESGSEGRGLPLLWEWHGKVYLGAAHGVVGILFTLLHFLPEVRVIAEKWNKDLIGLLQSTIDRLDILCFSSGNLASSIGSSKDRLVHWCHGAPGHVLLLVKSAEVFENSQYLEKAKIICEKVVFTRGLLRKGLGLCHGIAGNAYSFLALHRALTRVNGDHCFAGSSNEWGDLARHFANFGISYLSELEHVPDRPYSLFEGVGGFAALLVDLQDPDSARFPCYEF